MSDLDLSREAASAGGIVHSELQTLGISPKAVFAFLFPLIGAVVAAGCDWIVSGQFDGTTIRTALAGLGASGLALLGAYLGKPGAVKKV